MKNLLVLFSLCAMITVKAQNTDNVKKRGPEDSYTRSSLSYLLLDFANDKYADNLRKSIAKAVIPQKFDNNNITTKYINAPYSHGGYNRTTPAIEMQRKRKITEALKNNKYASKIMRYWWQVKDDGSYSTDLIKKRGLYNATDMDVNVVDASKVGRARLADAGLNLIGKSYVLVLDYGNIRTMKEIYDAEDAEAKKTAERESTEFIPVKRIRNGFKGYLKAYLFKLNYSDTIQGYLDASFIDENKLDVNKFDNIFNNIHTPYRFLLSVSVEADGTQLNRGQPLAPLRQKSPEELFLTLVQSGVDKAVGSIERKLESFRVKAPVTGLKPIKAKIGTKEGIRHERRFYVWEYVANRKEKIVAKKVGTIRAWHVVNNKFDKLGHTQESEFYQIGGRKIEEGMTLQERKDVGIGIGVGTGSLGFHIQGDVNAGQFLNLPMKQFKVYLEVFFAENHYDDVLTVAGSTMKPSDDYNEVIWSLGFLKEYPISKGNLRLGWKLGMSGQKISWEIDEAHLNYDPDRNSENIAAFGLAWGFSAGINLFSPSLHLIGSVGGYHHFGANYSSGEKDAESVKLDNSLSEIFPNKKSILLDLSLRLSF